MGRIFSLLRMALVFAALSGLTLIAAVPAAQAVDSGSHIYNQRATGKCLDMTGGKKGEGVQPQIWECNTNSWQYWTEPAGHHGYFLIKNDHSGNCLSILTNNPNPGAEVIQWPCSARDNFENWHKVDCSGSHCRLQNEGNHNYMEPSGCGTEDGDKIYMNVCSNGADVWH